MPPEWEEDFWNELSNDPSSNKQNKLNKPNGPSVTLRPPLYNAEDYTTALKQHFSSHSSQHKNKPSVLIEHSTSAASTGFYEKNVVVAASNPKSYMDHLLPDTPPEMSMRKFLNGSELLFKLEADLRHAYPTFVQEFVSGQSEGVACLLETLKMIQASIDHVTGLREQRKLFMDELKCLHCLRLCLRNIEAVSKLASYPGGLYPLASAMISTVTTTRIIALEILTCVCSEGGSDGHFKVSEAISTLRLRMGEPIRCKLLIGAISSAPPGTFQAKGIKFLTAWVSSASSPKQKVHIQCELEEAGFNPHSLRKGAELGGARESREVQSELDAWNNVSIDVDTLTRQNGQLRNSVATLQQELATLKDKIKKMDVPQKPNHETPRNRPTTATNNLTTPSKPIIQRAEELATTPVDSEEEAEQIHQILEDLNNIVNSEMNQQQQNIVKKSSPSKNKKKEKEIVPIHLVKSPPPKKLLNSNPPVSTPSTKPTRPWPNSSASEDYYDDDDDDDSDIIQAVHSLNNIEQQQQKSKNVRQVVEQIEQQQQHNDLNGNGNNTKLYQKHSTKAKSMSPIEPKPDYYNLPNFHKQNHMANKFVNFKSSKLYSSSPDNSLASITGTSPTSNNNNSKSHHQLPMRISPTLEKVKRNSSKHPQQEQNQVSKGRNGAVNGHGQLRRSESLHTSLTSIIFPRKDSHQHHETRQEKRALKSSNKQNNIEYVEKWKSVDNLHHENGGIDGDDDDENKSNFTLRWKYPNPQVMKSHPSLVNGGSPGSEEKMRKHSKSKSPTSGKKGHDKKTNSGSSPVENNPENPNNIRGVFELYTDYRQSRFTNGNGPQQPNSSPKQSSKGGSSNIPTNNGGGGLGTLNFFSRYSKKSANNSNSGGSNSSGNSAMLGQVPQGDKKKKSGHHGKSTKNNSNGHCINIDTSHHHESSTSLIGTNKEQSITMFSLPPIFVSQGIDIANHRICDLPSGLY